MPTKNTSTYETIPWATYQGGCGYASQSQTVMTKAVSVVTMDTLRRRRPICLPCNPTQGTILRLQDWSAGVYTVTFPYGCGADPKGTATVYYPYTAPGERYPYLATPDAPQWGAALRKKLKGKAVNLATICGEYRETADLFSNTAKKVGEAVKATREAVLRPGKALVKLIKGVRYDHRKSTRAERRKAIQDVIGAHFMASFAINPLLLDLNESLEKLQRVELLRERIHVKVLNRVERTAEVGMFAYAGLSQASARATLYVSYDPTVLRNSGFSGGNPLEVAWELTKLSWVVDYLIPVGDWLASLDAMVGVQSYYGTVTLCDERDFWKEALVKGGQGSFRAYHWHEKIINRSVIGDIPLPILFNYEPSSHFKSLVNATALLGQMRLKGR